MKINLGVHYNFLQTCWPTIEGNLLTHLLKVIWSRPVLSLSHIFSNIWSTLFPLYRNFLLLLLWVIFSACDYRLFESWREMINFKTNFSTIAFEINFIEFCHSRQHSCVLWRITSEVHDFIILPFTPVLLIQHKAFSSNNWNELGNYRSNCSIIALTF